MPQHEIRMALPATTQVVNADVTFTVYSDGRRLGQLRVSRGTLDWHPAGKKDFASVGWERFDDWMRDHGGFE